VSESDGGGLLLAVQRNLLEAIAMGKPLNDCLAELCRAVPRLSPRTRAGILLADKACTNFRSSIFPDFPPSWIESLKGSPIGEPVVGTCAEALLVGHQVVCPSIEDDGRWSETWRDLCLEYGVRACVSEPIQGLGGTPLGSFVLCFDEAREPTVWERRMAKFGTFIASIALTREHTASALRQSEERYQTLFRSIDAGFCVVQMTDESKIDFCLLEANPAFRRMTRLRRPVGKSARSLAVGLEEDWYQLLAGVAVKGKPVRTEKRAWDRWYELYSYRVDHPRDRKIAILFDDITARKREEIHMKFLASLSQDLNQAIDPEEIMKTVGARIGAFMDLSVCAFLEIDENAEEAVVACDWHRPDVPDLVGIYPLADYLSEDFQETARKGEVFVVKDTAKDRRLIAEQYLPLKIRSFVSVPILHEGQWRFALSVYHSVPHDWRDDEIDLLQRVTRRIWTRLERAHTEEALYESERKLRQIFEGAKDFAIFSVNCRGYFTSWSPGAEQIFGYEEKEVMGRHSEMIFTPMDRAEQVVRIEMAKALKTGVAEAERWHLRKDGSRFFASGLMQPIFDRSGKHVGFTKICRDSTAHQESKEWLERELVDSQRLQALSARLVAEGDFDSLLDEILGAAIAIARADMGTASLVDVESGTGLKLFSSEGFSPETVEQIQMHSSLARLPGRERLVIQDMALSDQLGKESIFRALVTSGVRAAQWTPLVSRSGRLVGVIATHWRRTHDPGQRELRLLDLLARQAADLIERHQSQAALREREQQLLEFSQGLEKRVERRTAELQEQTARLQRLAAELASAEQRERKRLAALLHDDLQQLLVAASMQLGMVPTSNETDAARAVAQASKWIEEARNAARDLTRQLRPPALYEDGLIAALHWLASEMQKKHYLEVSIEGSEPAEALSDDIKALLFECIRELLFNSAKYSGVSRASVTLRETGGRLQITVSDAGVGFDVKTVGVWRQSGGFGLFSIRERLIALGGQMVMISAPGQGTRMELYAPVEKVATNLPKWRLDFIAPANDPFVKIPVASYDTRIHVLVVDDHPMVREGIASILDSDTRLTVVAQAADGIEAISAVEQYLPDVVLMDVNMPRMNGVEATREIHRRWPETRIIGLSVQDDTTTAKSMCDAGAAAFISKSGASGAMIAAIIEQVPGKLVAPKLVLSDGMEEAAQDAKS
jgi:PAS domain S-box-containing protein